MQRQMRVFAAGLLGQRVPGLHCDMAVRLRRELQHDLAGIDIGVDPGHALGDALSVTRPFSSPSWWTSVCGIPGDALAAVADLLHQGPSAVNRL